MENILKRENNSNTNSIKLIKISKEYILAAEILLKAYEQKNAEIGTFKPFMYVLCHAYECYLKSERILNDVSGKERSHSLIDLSKDLMGKINDDVFQYSIWLSNHHYLRHENGNAFPDRYDDYKFDSKKTIDLWNKVKERQHVLGLGNVDALGAYNQELKDKLDPDYSDLRKLVSNSVRIIPKDFNDCVNVLKNRLDNYNAAN